MGRPKKTVADQPQIPGTETPHNKKVHAAAVRYADRRDERIAANVEEKDAHKSLLEIMDAAGISSYVYNGLEIHIDQSRKAKVKIEGRTSPAEGSDE
jgi:hypothetical protein